MILDNVIVGILTHAHCQTNVCINLDYLRTISTRENLTVINSILIVLKILLRLGGIIIFYPSPVLLIEIMQHLLNIFAV